MERDTNIFIKVSMGKYYTFFNSEGALSFTAGTKQCDIRLRGQGAEDCNFVFDFDERAGAWFAKDVSEGKTARLNRRPFEERRVKIKEGDTITVRENRDRKSTASVSLEVIKKINQKTKSNLSAIPLKYKTEHIIGRDSACDIVADNPQVNERHCKIIYDGKSCFVEDLRSLNGTFVNNRKIKRHELKNYDRISVPGAAYIFFEFSLLHSKSANGIEITAENVEKVVCNKGSRVGIKLVDNISMRISAGDFVAVVGGSGAGKSTFVDCLNGLRPATAGKVLYDGNDYYENLNSYRGVVGIVPQRDIMHDDITLFQALRYTANIRMRNALYKDDLDKHVRRVIGDVKLTGKENLKISLLSGGQRKRVSIAMELLADPKILFLDEPTSGLSPDLDCEMMQLLKDLAKGGRTIIIITHSMENIELCDKIAVLGKGGRLCFYGVPDEVEPFFETHSWASIFSMLSSESKAEAFRKKYNASLVSRRRVKKSDKPKTLI